MKTERHLATTPSEGYELIDSGDHMKLERFGAHTLARPDTQAIWPKNPSAPWDKAAATFLFNGGKGSWNQNELPESWNVSMSGMTLKAKLSSFKHTGLFPEQEPNWSWSTEQIAKLKSPKVLNLFGYTGAASVAAALAGAEVTHVDSSKASIAWAKENADASGITEGQIRYMHEDVRAFVKREIRRGAKYEGILLDPPAFGRGSKDEVWKIEEDLLPLVELLKELLSPEPGSFFLLNGYAAGYAPLSFAELVQAVFPAANTEYGELRIQEAGGRELPCGMYVRFTV